MLALISMVIILVTVIVKGFTVPAEARGSFSTPLLTVNTGIFQAIGVISFGMYTLRDRLPSWLAGWLACWLACY